MNYEAVIATGAGAGYTGYAVAQPGRPRRNEMVVGLGALGYGIGTLIAPGGGKIGMMIGIAVANYFFQEEKIKLTIPEEKNDLLTPASLVSSNVVVPLGFGKFYSAGNILDFKIQRVFDWNGKLPDPGGSLIDDRVYFIAVGISANPAELIVGKMGGMPFVDLSGYESIILEEYPNGGRATLPDNAQSFYHASFTQSNLQSWDTDWVHLFSPDKNRIDLTIEILYPMSKSVFYSHIKVHLQTKIEGETTDYLVQYSDWTYADSAPTRYFYFIKNNLVEGDYRITIEADEWLRNPSRMGTMATGLNILDHYSWWTNLGPNVLRNWTFNCNWFAFKYDDTDFDTTNSDFDLECDQKEYNPILNLTKYLTNDEWGLGIPEEKIDTVSFDALQVVCDGASPKRIFNGLFTAGSTPQAVINQFLIVSKALMVYSEGKLKLIEDKLSTPVKTFQESNTLQNTFQYSQRDTDAMISRFKLDFEDAEHSHVVRSVLFDDVSLINKIGIKDTSQFLTGVSTVEQATDIGQYVFRTLRQPNVAVLRVSINDADVQPGDMVEVVRPAVQYGDVMRIIELQEQSNGDIQISLVSYFPEDELVVISTEDDFRAGIFVGTELRTAEDGEVVCDSILPPLPPVSSWNLTLGSKASIVAVP